MNTNLTTPAWASSTREPDDGYHQGHVTLGDVTLDLGQNIRFNGEPEVVHVWVEVERLEGAPACRGLAAALLEAARVIDGATLSSEATS